MANAHSAVPGLGLYSISNLLERILLCRCPQQGKNYLTHNHHVPLILHNRPKFRRLLARLDPCQPDKLMQTV